MSWVVYIQFQLQDRRFGPASCYTVGVTSVYLGLSCGDSGGVSVRLGG